MSYVWLPVDVNLWQNHKTARLARLLSIGRAEAVGHLVVLWSWASVHAPDGNLNHLDSEDIATAADWSLDAVLFSDALESAGFLDPDGALHDWEEHQGATFRKRLSEADRKRRQRAALAGQERDKGGTRGTDRTGQDRTNKASVASDEATVFAYWKQVMGKNGRTVMDAPRRTAIMRALKVLSVDDCKRAIDGCRNTPHNMGENDRGEKYNDVTLIFRDAAHWERFMERGSTRPGQKPLDLRARETRIANALAELDAGGDPDVARAMCNPDEWDEVQRQCSREIA